MRRIRMHDEETETRMANVRADKVFQDLMRLNAEIERLQKSEQAFRNKLSEALGRELVLQKEIEELKTRLGFWERKP